MYTFEHVATLQTCLQKLKSKGQIIGFCPTMGALHEGHMSLIAASQSACDSTVCSIFVNPTQFNDKEDLIKYPRPFEEDYRMLKSKACDILFAPTTDEVYPPGLDTSIKVDLGGMKSVMEGKFRPGHFDGMLEVVHRLLQIVKPDQLFMGQKDYQQQTLVRAMIRQLELPVTLVTCPIIREADGLAMSSRNRLLEPEFRAKAPLIYQCLSWIKAHMDSKSPREMQMECIERLETAGLKAEYLSFADGVDLREVHDISRHEEVVVCTAVWAGKVRLIDNIILK